MKNITLIEQLTWAIVEVSLVNGKPDLARVADVLSQALGNAVVAREQEKRMAEALVRTAAVVGEPLPEVK